MWERVTRVTAIQAVGGHTILSISRYRIAKPATFWKKSISPGSAATATPRTPGNQLSSAMWDIPCINVPAVTRKMLQQTIMAILAANAIIQFRGHKFCLITPGIPPVPTAMLVIHPQTIMAIAAKSAIQPLPGRPTPLIIQVFTIAILVTVPPAAITPDYAQIATTPLAGEI